MTTRSSARATTETVAEGSVGSAPAGVGRLHTVMHVSCGGGKKSGVRALMGGTGPEDAVRSDRDCGAVQHVQGLWQLRRQRVQLPHTPIRSVSASLAVPIRIVGPYAESVLAWL